MCDDDMIRHIAITSMDEDQPQVFYALTTAQWGQLDFRHGYRQLASGDGGDEIYASFGTLAELAAYMATGGYTWGEDTLYLAH